MLSLVELPDRDKKRHTEMLMDGVLYHIFTQIMELFFCLPLNSTFYLNKRTPRSSIT